MNFDLSKLKKPVSKEVLTQPAEKSISSGKELRTAKKIMLSPRPSEREKLKSLAEEEGLPLGTWVMKTLKKHGYI